MRLGETESRANIFMPFYHRILTPCIFGDFLNLSLLNILPSQKIIGTIDNLVFEAAELMLGRIFMLNHNKNLPIH